MIEKKEDFFNLLDSCGAFKWASEGKSAFLLKSGRTSRYFIDFSSVQSAKDLQCIGTCYGQAILDLLGEIKGDSVVVFGPAYKGISLVFSVLSYFISSMALSNENVFYCFNRKEEKDHGEGGVLIGRTPKKEDKVFIVDDVITSGISIDQAIRLLQKNSAVSYENIFIVAGVDRLEKSVEDPAINAKEWLEKKHQVKVKTLCSVDELRQRALEKFKKKIKIVL